MCESGFDERCGDKYEWILLFINEGLKHLWILVPVDDPRVFESPLAIGVTVYYVHNVAVKFIFSVCKQKLIKL